MSDLMAFGLIVAWLVVGFGSHVYWVTNQYDYTADQLPNAVLAAAVGPLAWFVGWAVYGTPADPKKQRVLFRQRNGV